MCLGRNEVAPLSGYWRLTKTSENILPCPNPDACLGGYNGTDIISYTGACATGYDGILCMECTDGFARYVILPVLSLPLFVPFLWEFLKSTF